MPKINQAGQPSYLGVSGNVTNAVGEQFELSPDAEGEDVVSLDAADQLTPSTGTDADLAGAPDDGDQPNDGEQDDATEGDAVRPANQTPGFDTPGKKTPAKKATAPKK